MGNLKKFSRTKKIFIASLLAITAFVAVIAMYICSAFRYPFKDSVNITINKNDTLYSVLDTLENKKTLKSKIITKIYIKYNKLNTTIKPGEYEIKENMNFEKFINTISKGYYDKNVAKITIPEGSNIEQISDILSKENVISKKEFLKSIKKYKLSNYIKNDDKRKYKLEGFLFPDTYVFKKGVSGKEILDQMTKRFNQVINELKKENNMDIEEKKIDDLIKMASIVEKEAKADAERPKIASVFYNRLKTNMKLQSCATVLYSLGYHKDKLYNKDLEVQSPYNTYNIKGLPVGPICNPGKKSIQAALKPEDTKYLYFVSKNDNTHFFTSDYNEFLKIKKQTQGF